MAIQFAADWNDKENHTPAAGMSSEAEVRDAIRGVCRLQTSTDTRISSLLTLIGLDSDRVTVQKGLHQDELYGTLGSLQHVRVRAEVLRNSQSTFHLYISFITSRTKKKVGGKKKWVETSIRALSSITYYRNSAKVEEDF